MVRWEPNPGPQQDLFTCPAEIILFGGAAGGGKTDAMLIDAARGIIHDGYQAIIFRRTYKELEKHIIERSKQLYGGMGRYNEKEYKWTFSTPNGGRAFIYLAYLERDQDVFNYHGAAFQFIGFDESCMFSAFQVRFMLSRLRTVNPVIRKRMLLCTNPLGPGFGWHKLMFIENAIKGKLQPGKIYRDAVWPDTEQPCYKTTCFIPSKIWDNPIQLKADPDYVNNIRSQGGALARALLSGSWDEALFMAVQFDKRIHVCEPFEIPVHAPRWMGIDWGKGDKAACVWQTSVGGRIYWYRDHARPGDLIKPFAEECVARSVGENISFAVLSHETFAERGANHTQADLFVEVFSKANIPIVRSDKDPEGRLMLLREMLRWTKMPTTPETKGLQDYDYWQGRINKEGDKAWKEYAKLKLVMEEGDVLPKLQMFGGGMQNLGCPYVISTIPLLTTKMDQPKKIEDGQDDHGFDAGTYGLKGYMMSDETSILEAYMKQIGGKIPDSGMAAELAMKAALEQHAEEHEDQPFQMETEPWSDGKPDFGAL